MIVFDLQCRQGNHVFEGWFSSSADFEDQRRRGLLICPVCGGRTVEKAVMAPAVGAKGNQKAERIPSSSSNQSMMSAPGHDGGAPDAAKVKELMQALAKAQAAALANSEWVGPRFADQARAMHYGEEDHRAIHGVVGADEARGLMEEGVDVAPLLFPVVPPEANN